jgi:4,5:9,10-diseco-3-hydroxy-5,9,17-trioxoandrosta-1(10),2-diene-4-oate hydrolase
MSRREELGVPAGSPTIEAKGVRLAIAREGRGPAVVCLHAIGHGGGDFAAFAQAVRGRFDIIRIDWPGQGRSGDDGEPVSAARYADLLEAALDRLGVEAPIVIGCSIGGAAALHYAARRRVRALVLCNPGGLRAVTPVAGWACRRLAGFFAAGERRARWFPPLFRAYYRAVLSSPDAAPQRQRITAAGFETAGVLRQAWESFGRPEADLRGLATTIDVPVWFAWATGDRLVRLDDARPCIAQMKRAEITEFAGGHAAFLEQPRRFAEEFIGFAGRLTPPARGAPLPARQACVDDVGNGR